jgi:hypothetical protein
MAMLDFLEVSARALAAEDGASPTEVLLAKKKRNFKPRN